MNDCAGMILGDHVDSMAQYVPLRRTQSKDPSIRRRPNSSTSLDNKYNIHIHLPPFPPNRYKQRSLNIQRPTARNDHNLSLQRSIRLINRQTVAVRNNQPILQIPILIHKPPLALPLLRVSVERFLPRLVVSFEPAKTKKRQ
jgi:hypothetical protein